jgi:hypothetical protein
MRTIEPPMIKMFLLLYINLSRGLPEIEGSNPDFDLSFYPLVGSLLEAGYSSEYGYITCDASSYLFKGE